jgi:hypothetical protein
MRKLLILPIVLLAACSDTKPAAEEPRTTPPGIEVRGIEGAVEVEYACPYAFRSLRHKPDGIEVYFDVKDAGCKEGVTTWRNVSPGHIRVSVFAGPDQEPVWADQVLVR